MSREFDSIWEAVESVLESYGHSILTDRLSQERYEESRRHEASILASQREAEEKAQERIATIFEAVGEELTATLIRALPSEYPQEEPDASQ